MTINERIARLAPYVQAERATAAQPKYAAEKKPDEVRAFDKWNDSPVFEKQPEQGRGEIAWQSN